MYVGLRTNVDGCKRARAYIGHIDVGMIRLL